MLQIKPLASGSSGNCYLIKDGSSSLLIEAGIPLQKIKEGLNYKVHELDGCLISHEHKDHCKSAGEIAKCGIDLYLSKGTFEQMNIISHRVNIIENKQQFELNNWTIVPFELKHDAEEPTGFLIYSQSTNEILTYITDTMYSKAVFPNVNYIMVECNYSLGILNKNVKSGRVPAVQKKRLVKTHFGLENVKDFLKANDLSQVRQIWLLHLSEQNSNAELFKKEIQQLTGKPTFIA